MQIDKIKDKLIVFCLFLTALFLLIKIMPHFVPFLNVVLSALIPFILAFVITYVLEPFVNFFEKKLNLKRNISFLLVYLIVLLLFILMILSIVPEVIKQFNSMINFIINNQGEIQTILSKYVNHYKLNMGELINKIKNEQTILRKSFLDIIQDITPELHKKIILNIDTLTDELTNVISNDEFKLCNSKTYEREIHTRIQNSDKYVLNQIFNYRG